MMKLKLRARLATAFFCSVFGTGALNAQAIVPLRTLSKPEAVTVLPFGAIESVRPLNKGGVLVNDSRKRQIVALDSTFASFTVVLDSASATGIRYGNPGSELVPYLSDSTLFRDVTTQKFFVIDPNGEIVHRFEPPSAGAEPLRITSPRGFDPFGNAIMPGIPQISFSTPRSITSPMTFLIVRANFAEHRQEELARYYTSPVSGVSSTTNKDGTRRIVQTVNPLPLSDDWTVLSDGTLAVVRASDYRIDMLSPNSTIAKSVKLPFEKRRLSNAHKQLLIDSTRAAIANAGMDPDKPENALMALAVGLQGLNPDSLRRLSQKNGGKFQVTGTPAAIGTPTVEFPPLKDIPDYLPPFRKGGLKADPDANLWILSNGASSFDASETIYDVVNNQATLVQRVRVPAGRTVVGFARGGVVYLKYQTADNAWMLERVRLQP